jgi:hypothetical protein
VRRVRSYGSDEGRFSASKDIFRNAEVFVALFLLTAYECTSHIWGAVFSSPEVQLITSNYIIICDYFNHVFLTLQVFFSSAFGN